MSGFSAVHSGEAMVEIARMSAEEEEAEDRFDECAAIMATPPNPVKASTRIFGRQRPRSGPFEGDEDGVR